MNARFQSGAGCALVALFLGACPVMEPPAPINMSGVLYVDARFSAWTMAKLVAVDDGGVVVGEAVPVRSGSLWTWKMPALSEESRTGFFWVEMMEAAGKPVFYNEGEKERFENGKNYTIRVTKKYIPVKNSRDLRAIGADAKHPRDGAYILIRDIRLSGVWEPLCNAGGAPFSGALEGRGRTVSGLVPADTGNFQYAGLFAFLDHATVSDLRLVLSATELELSGASPQCFGALAGAARDSSVRKVSVSGPSKGLRVKAPRGGDLFVGALVGKIEGAGDVSRSVSRLSITAEADSAGKGCLGGIAGYAAGSAAGSVSISDCYNTGALALNIDGTGAFSGGILGYHEALSGRPASRIERCYSTGNVSASCKSAIPAVGTVAAGGLVGGGKGVAAERSCALMGSVWAFSPNALLVSGGALGGFGLLPSGAANCFRSDAAVVSPPSGVDAGKLVSGGGVRESLFKGSPLNWDFTSVWVWDAQSGFPVLR
jgi:hypothetical protein